MFDVSVIICTHNPRPEYFSRVLEALRNQTLPRDQWQLLIVDNLSDVSLKSKWDLNWHENARYIFEDELGIAAARQRGIREASGDLLIFVDDDNVLDENYLSEALSISSEYCWLGVWGSGDCEGEYEVEPLDHLRAYLHFLALRKVNALQSNADFSSKVAMPWGAGLCLRKSVGLKYCQKSEQSTVKLSSRRGKTFDNTATLMGGEDLEICIVACMSGFAMGVFPQLKLIHLIPKERLTESYLVKLGEAHATTDILIKYKWRGIVPRRAFSIISMIGLMCRIVLYRGIHRKMQVAYWRAVIEGNRIIRTKEGGGALNDKRQGVDLALKRIEQLEVRRVGDLEFQEGGDRGPAVALTVLFSCYNGEVVLANTLQAYTSLVSPGVPWKLVVVNNGSSDRTASILNQFQNVLPLKILNEPVAGKNRALNRGIADREGKLIIITDDDAIPDKTFLVAWSKYLSIRNEYGILGGRIKPLFEQNPPAWFLNQHFKFDVLYAERLLQEGPVDPGDIFGPNMAVRSAIFDGGIRFNEMIGPNASDAMYPMGSETEFCRRVSRSGVACWYTNEPLVQHFIRKIQITENYCARRGYRHGRGVAQQLWENGEIAVTTSLIQSKIKTFRYWMESFTRSPQRKWKSNYFFNWERGFSDELRRSLRGK